MKNIKNYQENHQHLKSPEEIWGVHFFWAKNLKFMEEEIKNATEHVLHPDKNEKSHEHFKKASWL